MGPDPKPTSVTPTAASVPELRPQAQGAARYGSMIGLGVRSQASFLSNLNYRDPLIGGSLIWSLFSGHSIEFCLLAVGVLYCVLYRERTNMTVLWLTVALLTWYIYHGF